MGTLKRTKKLQTEDFSESVIQKVLTKEYMTNPKYVLYNLYVFPWESDFLFCTRAGYWHEVEIKISFADFKNEFKHKQTKYHILKTGCCTHHGRLGTWNSRSKQYDYEEKTTEVPVNSPNYFSYCVPYYILDKVRESMDKEHGFGLYYIDEYGKLHCDMVPAKLRKDKISDEELYLTEKFYYAYRTWYQRCQEWHETERKLRGEVASLKAEYKAVTGESIQESAC